MLITGNDHALYAAMGLYAAALGLYLMRARGAGLGALATGLAAHIFYLAGRGFIAGVFVANPMFEGPYLLPCAIAMIALVSGLKNRQGGWGLLLIAGLALFAFALFYPRGMIPPTPKKVTLWANLFFCTEVFGHAFFYCGAILASASLIRGDDDPSFHRYVLWGFLIYSVAQVTGAVWCYLGWGNTFRWGSRHMMSAAIWLFYAAYLHLRFMPGWDRRRKALFAMAGAVITIAASYSSYVHEMFFPRIGG